MSTTLQLKANYERIYRETGIVDSPRLYHWIAGLLNAHPGARVLDVACGEGRLVYEARQQGLDAIGVDLAEAALQKARRLTGNRFAAANAEQLPFRTGTFDYVTCLGSLENMAHPDIALAELTRAAKDDALFCLLMPNAFWLGDVVSTATRGTEDVLFQEFERRATPQAWRQFLTAHGLVIEREHRYNRPAVLFRNGKLRSIRKFVSRSLLNLCTPFNLSWSFVFLCRKDRSWRQNGTALGLLWEGRPAGVSSKVL